MCRILYLVYKTQTLPHINLNPLKCSPRDCQHNPNIIILRLCNLFFDAFLSLDQKYGKRNISQLNSLLTHVVRDIFFKGLAALLLAGAITSASAQEGFYEKAKIFTLKNDPAGYQQRDNDIRFEGLYRKNVANSGFELVSVTKGSVNYNLDLNDTLIIRTPRVLRGRLIGICGLSFGITKNYRLDFVMFGDSHKRVPIGPVLYSKEIDSANIGLYGYLGHLQSPDAYVPVIISTKTHVGTGPITLKLIADVPVARVEYMISKCDNNNFSGYGAPITLNRSFDISEPITIKLNQLPAWATPGTIICVLVRVAGNNSDEHYSTSFKVVVY